MAEENRDDAPYTEAEVDDLARFMWEMLGMNEVNAGWDALDDDQRARLKAGVREGGETRAVRAALSLMRRNPLYAPTEAALRRTPLAAALVRAGASAQYAANQFEMALSDAQEAHTRYVMTSAQPMRIVVEAAPNTLPITREDAELFREALRHLPGFVEEKEQAVVLAKLRTFLDGAKS